MDAPDRRPRGCAEPDALELRAVLGDVRLALVVATEMEAEPLLPALAGPEPLHVAGRPWWVGTLEESPDVVPAVLLVSGYDKVNTAHALTCLLGACCPELVVQVGVAGAYTGAGLQVGDLVLATEEAYGDTGVLTPDGWQPTDVFGLPLARVGGKDVFNVFSLDSGLVEAAARVVGAMLWEPPGPRVAMGRCLTMSQVTGIAEVGDRLAARWGALAESMEGAAAAHVCALSGVSFLEVRGVSNLVTDRDRAGWDLRGAADRAGRAALAVCARLDEVLVARRGARQDLP